MKRIIIKYIYSSIVVYLFAFVKMKSSTQPKSKAKPDSKEKPELIVEKMEGGILVRRYKGKKVEIESKE